MNAQKNSRKKWFYERDRRILKHPVNKTFDELLWMSDAKFKEWVIDLRKFLVKRWDEKDLPPCSALTEEQIIEQFQKLSTYRVELFLRDDCYANTKQDVIENTSTQGGTAVNQWFPTMMKTRINNSKDFSKGLSFYEYFTDENLIDKTVSEFEKNFKRDSFYKYSPAVPRHDKETKEHKDKFLYACKTGREWIIRFEKEGKKNRQKYDYWLSPDKEYTGSSEELRNKEFLLLTKKEIQKLPIPKRCKSITSKYPNEETYRIRIYKKQKKIFPDGLSSIRNSSLCQNASNFPPLTAKFLYERYLFKLGYDKNNQKATIWDPSAGWGGRILGAMAVKDCFHVHYIGSDPNTDHNTTDGRTKYHEVADFYNKLRAGEMPGYTGLDFGDENKTNTYEIFQFGSEIMNEHPGFKKHKGKIDIVFTSPPYFGKEVYSEDKEQSANKFSEYDSWRDGFLKPTLQTASEWLRPGGYLLWSISNVTFSTKSYPLEADSCSILDGLGLKHVETLKMALASKPGGNRTKEEEVLKAVHTREGTKKKRQKTLQGTTEHFCKVRAKGKEKVLKYEPIFVYQKPSDKKQKSQKSEYGSSTIDLFNHQQELCQSVHYLANEFETAISDEEINPHWLRAIYAALESLFAESKDDSASGAFNAYNESDYFLVKNRKISEHQFVKPKLTRRKTKSLIGKHVFLQILNDKKNGNVERLFAWGKVTGLESSDSGVWSVKISRKQEYAEDFLGLTLSVGNSDDCAILRVDSSPVKLFYKKANWSY